MWPMSRFASAVWLSKALGRPLLLEGDAGVGQDRPRARPLPAKPAGATSVRLQCFDGLDFSAGPPTNGITVGNRSPFASVRPMAQRCERKDTLHAGIFARAPLLKALTPGPCVLLIDEVDRADVGRPICSKSSRNTS
jgi:hypothetical protein